MSWLPSNDPILGDPESCDALELVVVPRIRDLGDGFEVRRALPHGKRQMVGPFIFFDHIGPVQFIVGQGHGRAPASAYRAGHRHLSVRRLDHPSRQRGQCPGDPAGRDEPDDRGARHRPFRAHAGPAAPRAARRCWACKAGSRCRGFARRWRRRSSIMPQPTCRWSSSAVSPRAMIAGRAFGITSPVDNGVAVVLYGGAAERASASRSTPITRSARSIWWTVRSKSPATATRDRGC